MPMFGLKFVNSKWQFATSPDNVCSSMHVWVFIIHVMHKHIIWWIRKFSFTCIYKLQAKHMYYKYRFEQKLNCISCKEQEHVVHSNTTKYLHSIYLTTSGLSICKGHLLMIWCFLHIYARSIIHGLGLRMVRATYSMLVAHWECLASWAKWTHIFWKVFYLILSYIILWGLSNLPQTQSIAIRVMHHADCRCMKHIESAYICVGYYDPA